MLSILVAQTLVICFYLLDSPTGTSDGPQSSTVSLLVVAGSTGKPVTINTNTILSCTTTSRCCVAGIGCHHHQHSSDMCFLETLLLQEQTCEADSNWNEFSTTGTII